MTAIVRHDDAQRKGPPTASPQWEERCLPQGACDWWFRGHEDKAHAIVADGPLDETTGMVGNYPSYADEIVARLFNDTVVPDVLRVLEGFCPWHNDRLDRGLCIDLPNDLSEAGQAYPEPQWYGGDVSLSWQAGTDETGTWIVGRWTDGVDIVSRRWTFSSIPTFTADRSPNQYPADKTRADLSAFGRRMLSERALAKGEEVGTDSGHIPPAPLRAAG